jgi:hypothetical protein
LRAALRDPAPWAMASVWAAYLASLPVLFPEYLGSVVPLVLDYYLANGGQTPLSVLLIPRLGVAALVLVALAAVAFARGGTLARVLALAGLGALASALVQQKGWSYHIVPVELFAGALALVLAARWLAGRRPVRVAAGLGWVFVLYLVVQGEAPWNQMDRADLSGGELCPGADDAADDEPVAAGGRLPGMPGGGAALSRGVGDGAAGVLHVPHRGRGFRAGAAGGGGDRQHDRDSGLRGRGVRDRGVFRAAPAVRRGVVPLRGGGAAWALYGVRAPGLNGACGAAGDEWRLRRGRG